VKIVSLKFGLYVTATPIGNLGDMTLRAVEVLKGVDAILCEDTRTTAKLLNHFGIKKPLIAYHEHNADKVRENVMNKLEGGESLALVSDAGTPLISDPGYKLVRAAQENNIPVHPIPGPAAPMAALMAAGLPTNMFTFVGFLPSKAGAKKKALEDLSGHQTTLIFFESPKRVVKTVAAMAEVFGAAREAAMCRELTKIYEEIVRLPLSDLLENLQARETIKGEIVLLVAPPEADSAKDVDVDRALERALRSLTTKGAAQLISDLTGKPRKELYDRALQLKGKK
jgi:16S rRNA (cytidine1402-2'-O)-methyltransferase